MGHFGVKLRAILRDRRVAPTDLAAACKTKPQQVNKWLTQKTVKLDTLFRIAKALDTSVESLIAGVDPEYDAKRPSSPERWLELLEAVKDPGERDLLWKLLLRFARIEGV